MRPVRKALFFVVGNGHPFLPTITAQPKKILTAIDKPNTQFAVKEAWQPELPI